MSFRSMTPLLLAFCALAGLAAEAAAQGRYLPPVAASRWQLGVAVRYVPQGCVITRVARASVAQQAGLEAGDIILSVNGGPLGYVGGRLYDLEDELNRRADVYGRVNLAIRNGRTGQGLQVPVKLAPAAHPFPPQPFPPQPLPPFPVPPIPLPPLPVPQPQPQPGYVAGVIDALYQRFFGRPADPGGLAAWTQQVAQGLSLSDVQVNLLASGEYYDRGGNNPRLFVANLFTQVVGRAAGPDEIQAWVARFVRDYRGDRMSFCRAFLEAYGKY